MLQNTIFRKYLNAQTDISEKWEVQKNNRNAKDEQYQGEFLIDLFIIVFGDTKQTMLLPN